MSRALEPLAIYPGPLRVVLRATVSLILIALPVAALLFFRPNIEQLKAASFRLYGLCYVAILLFLVLGLTGLLFNFYRLVVPRPLAVISAEGITLDLQGFITWEEIDYLEKLRHQGQRLLAIFPKDPEAIRARLGWWSRFLSRSAERRGFPPFYLTQSNLPMTIDELLAAVRRYSHVKIEGQGDER